MIHVEPSVHLVGKTHSIKEGMYDALEAMGADPKWVEGRQVYGETLIEFMGRLCYGSFEVGLNPNVTKIRPEQAEYLENVISQGHGSVFEHSTLSFAFINISRVFTHELVRHRVGTAMSQESLRYVRLDELKGYFPLPTPVTPEQAQSVADLKDVLESAFDRSAEYYLEVLGLFAELEGVTDFNDLPFAKKKEYTSFARRVAPIGLATKIGWTSNIRTLRHVIEMRTSRHAEIEIRHMYNDVFGICVDQHPAMFSDVDVKSVDGFDEIVFATHA